MKKQGLIFVLFFVVIIFCANVSLRAQGGRSIRELQREIKRNLKDTMGYNNLGFAYFENKPYEDTKKHDKRTINLEYINREVFKDLDITYLEPDDQHSSMSLVTINETPLSEDTVRVDIDTTISYQTITGWEATMFIVSECNPHFSVLRDAILPYVIDSIGITRVRLEIRSGVEHTVDNYQIFLDHGCPSAPDTNYQKWRSIRYATVNDNDDPKVINWAGFQFSSLDWKIDNILIPLKQMLEKRGLKLFINLCYVAFTGQIKDGEYIHNNPDEYAEFVLATYLHMKEKYGFVPDTWEVILEPDNVREWNGILIGQAIVKAAERLQEYGFVPRFVAPSTTNMANAITYLDDIVKVPKAIDYLEEISYHRYGGVSRSNLQQIVQRSQQYGKNTSMLEWWFDNATHKVLYEDLAIGNNSAFQQSTFNLFFDIDTTDWDNLKINIRDVTQYNRLYYLFIRPGAIRKKAITSDTNIGPLAFVNGDTSFTLILDSDKSSLVNIFGLRPGRYTVKFTTETAKFADGGQVVVQSDGKLSLRIPKGVVALSLKSNVQSLVETSSLGAEIFLAPNPASEFITIWGRMDFFREEIKIYNAKGECLARIPPLQDTSIPQERKIDISKFPTGFYYIRIGNIFKYFLILR